MAGLRARRKQRREGADLQAGPHVFALEPRARTSKHSTQRLRSRARQYRTTMVGQRTTLRHSERGSVTPDVTATSHLTSQSSILDRPEPFKRRLLAHAE